MEFSEFANGLAYAGSINSPRPPDTYTDPGSAVQATVILTGAKGVAYFPFISRTDTYIGSKDAAATYFYDNYGNLIEEDDLGDSVSDARTILTTYTTANTDNYLVGYPTEKQIFLGLGPTKTLVSQSQYYYDNSPTQLPTAGNLTKDDNLLIGGTDPIVTYAYDAFGNQTDTYDAIWNATNGQQGNHTHTTYESTFHQFPQSLTQGVGSSLNFPSEQFVFDPKTGQMITHVDVNGSITTYNFDAFGRLGSVIGPNDNATYPTQTYQYVINTSPPSYVLSQARVVHGSSGTLNSYAFFDGMGRKIESKGDGPANSQIISDAAIYDDRGLVVTSYAPFSQAVSPAYVAPNAGQSHTDLTYDALSRIVLVTHADGSQTSHEYQDWTETDTDANGHSKTTIKNAYGQIAEVDENYNNNQSSYTTTYQYDAVGNLTKITNSLNQTSALTYDSLGRKIAIADPQMGDWQYQHDANGNLVRQTDAKGQIITMTYDPMNRLALKVYPDATFISYQYDTGPFAIGRLSQVNDLSGSQSFMYDNAGNVLSKKRMIGGKTYTTSMTYDALGRETSLTYPDYSTVNNLYDASAISSIESADGSLSFATLAYSTVAPGQVSQMKYGNGLTMQYAYDPSTYRLNSLITTLTNATPIQNFSYQYDPVGNISRINDGVGPMTQNFQYDEFDRLIQAVGPYGNKSYTYDSLGNVQLGSSSSSTRPNVALKANGATASASSEYNNGQYPAANAITGNQSGAGWGTGAGGWNDNTSNAYPDWLEVDFAGTKNIQEVDVYTVQDNFASPATPTASMTFSQFGITDFEVQYYNGSAWADVPGGHITGNNLVWRQLTFATVSTAKIRILVNNSLGGYSRITDVEAYEPSAPSRPNVALKANGAIASASSEYNGGQFPATNVITGNQSGAGWGTGAGGWNDNTPNAYPDWLEVDFAGTKNIQEVDVYTVQDDYASPATPTASMTFSQFGITDFEVQYYNGSAWADVPGGHITGNNLVWRQLIFAAVSTAKIRVLVNNSLGGYSRITDVEAYEPSAPSRPNVSLKTNGATASASSEYNNGQYVAANAITGNQSGAGWGTGAGGWNDNTSNAYPDWLEVDFAGTKNIQEVDVYTVQDNFASPATPTASMTFSQFGITDFEVQYYNGSAWADVPGGHITRNNLVWRQLTFATVSTAKIRILVNNSLGGYSRITDVEAYESTASSTSSSGSMTAQTDANGNILVDSNLQITYDFDNRPMQIVTASGIVTQFVYDFEGNRVQKTVTQGGQTQTTTYLGGIYEVTGSQSIKYITAGSLRVAMVDSTGDVTYFLPDHLGSTNILADSSQNILRTTQYTPFGSIYQTNGTTDNDHKFTGQRLDDSTGLYYYGARYYDPILGRFITPDSIVQNPYDPQTLNRYTYCRNNPIIYIDPNGHSFWGDLGRALNPTNWAPQVGKFLDQNKYYIAEAALIAVTYGAATPAVAGAGTLGQAAAEGALAGEVAGAASNIGGNGSAMLLGSIEGGVQGGVTAGFAYGIDTSLPINVNGAFSWGDAAGQVGFKGIVGAVMTEAQGGSFVKGFEYSAVFAGVDVGYQTVVHYAPHAGPGNEIPGGHYDEANGAPEGMDVVGNNPSEYKSNLAPLDQGGSGGRALNMVPGINATADLHDDVFDSGFLPKVGWNWQTMVPAFSYSSASLLGGDWMGVTNRLAANASLW